MYLLLFISCFLNKIRPSFKFLYLKLSSLLFTYIEARLYMYSCFNKCFVVLLGLTPSSLILLLKAPFQLLKHILNLRLLWNLLVIPLWLLHNCSILNFFVLQKDSPLHKIKWLRVILDEGHTIRNPQTRLTKAMLDLEASRRWVLTGTPIQNRLDDLWSLFRFLRLKPFDDNFWWNSNVADSVRRGCPQGVKYVT